MLGNVRAHYVMSIAQAYGFSLLWWCCGWVRGGYVSGMLELLNVDVMIIAKAYGYSVLWYCCG